MWASRAFWFSSPYTVNHDGEARRQKGESLLHFVQTENTNSSEQFGRGGFGQRGGQRQDRSIYQEVERKNPRYEAYYNTSGIISVDEQAAFWDAQRRELPSSFRFTGSKRYSVGSYTNFYIFIADQPLYRHAVPVRQRLKEHYVPEITSIQYEGESVEPPTAIPWYPEQLGWQMTTNKNVVRRFPPFASFQKFLVSETSVGNINRQEVVSMIPPLLMGIKPGMTVLDMCAAPGSKACQLIEMIHEGEEARLEKQRSSSEWTNSHSTVSEEDLGDDWSDQGRATGLLIANDSDYKRAHMLIHQMKRLNSPNLIVTNHDASIFPSIKLPSKPGTANNQYLKFDRILADVPCSGDGTGRKNPNVWKDWNPANAMGLHSLQVRILIRALQMLKIGGRVVYSTCSMNPVENEAVVASVISACGGYDVVEIVDCGDEIPELKRRPGLTEWKVMDKSGKMWSSWLDAKRHIQESGMDNMGKMSEGQFPPPASNTLRLERCMRVYPHLQDTGGFFITVLQKKSAINVATQPQPQVRTTQPSVTTAVREIEESTANGTDPSSKILALDGLVPPPSVRDAEGISAASRQNMENASEEPVTANKRALDEQGDARAENKRLKMRDDKDADYPAVQGGEDRQVHFPPPPGAQLDVSRPEIVEHSPTKTNAPQPMSPSPQPTASAPDISLRARNPVSQNSRVPYEEPFFYLPSNHPVLSEITTFYTLSPDFPRDRFMVRNAAGVPVKTIYYTSSLARDILTTNSGVGMKFVHCGVKMFCKQDTQGEGVCPWRIQNEGMTLVERFVSEERVVKCWRRSTLKRLLQEMFPKVGGEAWQELGEVGEQVKDKGMGCLVLRIGAKEREQTNDDAASTSGNGEHTTNGETSADDKEVFAEPMVLPLWRSLHSVNLMLPKEDRKALLLRLFGIEMAEIKDTSKERFKRKQQQQQNGHTESSVMEAGNAPPDMPDGPSGVESEVAHVEEERRDSERRRRNTSSPEPEAEEQEREEGDGAARMLDGVIIPKSGDIDNAPGKEAGDAMDLDDPEFPNTTNGVTNIGEK